MEIVKKLTFSIFKMTSSRLNFSSSLANAEAKPSRPPTPSSPISKPLKAPMAAAAEGLSKLRAPMEDWPIIDVAGDFLTCCGEDRWFRGEKAACAAEKGVDTGGVAPASCDGVIPEGVRPCCEGACFIGVGVAISIDGVCTKSLRINATLLSMVCGN